MQGDMNMLIALGILGATLVLICAIAGEVIVKLWG